MNNTTKAVKVFPSSLVTTQNPLEPVRSAKYVASSFQVEVVHIVVFVTLIMVIFGGLWKAAAKLTNKKQKKAFISAAQA